MFEFIATKKGSNALPSRKGSVSTFYKRRIDASPIYQFSNSSLASSAIQIFDIELDNPTAWKYAPFTNVRIANNSGIEIEFRSNQQSSTVFSCPSGTITVIPKELLGGLTSFAIKNVGSSTASANTVRIEVWKEAPDTDTVSNKVYRTLFGGAVE